MHGETIKVVTEEIAVTSFLSMYTIMGPDITNY